MGDYSSGGRGPLGSGKAWKESPVSPEKGASKGLPPAGASCEAPFSVETTSPQRTPRSQTRAAVSQAGASDQATPTELSEGRDVFCTPLGVSPRNTPEGALEASSHSRNEPFESPPSLPKRTGSPKRIGGPPQAAADSGRAEGKRAHEGPTEAPEVAGKHVLAVVRKARQQRSLKAPLSIEGETAAAIAAVFEDVEGGGLSLEVFRERVVEPLLGLGPFLAGPLFRRIDSEGIGLVTAEQLREFWRGRFVLRSKDPSLQCDFPLSPLPTYCSPESHGLPESSHGAGAPALRRGSLINFMGALAIKGPFIYPEDLRPWIVEVAECAPDMAFLLDPQSEEYLHKYVDSVIARIMFYVDEDSKGCLSMRDLRRSALVHVWCSLNPSMELSAVRKFFSYDHFYVFYCSFHELDEDEDFLLHRSDVSKYQDHSMSTLVEARLFSQAAHRFSCEKSQHWNFQDWIWFVLAYHEVTLPKALRFWFDVFDLDGDGFLRDHELEAAYESQAERLRMREGKAQSYKEFICQAGKVLAEEVESVHCAHYFLKACMGFYLPSAPSVELLVARFLHGGVKVLPPWGCRSDALGLAPSSSGISCQEFLRSPAAAGFLVNCLLKAQVLRAFDEGEAVINTVHGNPIERAVLLNFTPFEIFAHAEYAAFTAQRFEESLELGDGRAERCRGEHGATAKCG
ncbi:probable serine/threonine protein phosphatase 2A regulatory subunit B''delta [Cyclospora cayetanensis]|uniref:Probable serine/threonine protein phosphatase 2A regulatory subunit B''delta n=1 Tax=Cyclospora cayetanensis TaxID=88456 RepID=A0A6P6S2V7_9EIME|nr:probable serine/threonine protein phosphatase 2A regulatory subunit B''delta [Cyclospora cayetanensis]